MTLLLGEDEGMNLSHWLAVVKAKMQALFQLPHVPRIRPGLMPVRKTVRRGGRTHEQTYYVRPENLAQTQAPKPKPPKPKAQPRTEAKSTLPPLLAFIEEASRTQNRTQPAKPKPPKPKAQPQPSSPLEALAQIDPRIQPKTSGFSTPEEAKEYLMQKIMSHPKGEIAHPEGWRMGLNIGLAVNEDPHLDAWRIYHERKEQAESSVVQERDQKAKRALDLWKNLQRTRNKKRRWELEYEYSRNASEVAYLDSVLHNLRAIRMALGDAPQAFYRKLGERITNELKRAHQRLTAQGEHLWQKLAPKVRRTLEETLGPRYLEGGGPIGGTLRTLYDLANDPTISRGANKIIPRLELVEERLKQLAQLWREYEARPSPETLRKLLESVGSLPTYYSPSYLIDEMGMKMPNETPKWFLAWERKARPLVRGVPYQDEAQRARRIATGLEWIEDHFRKIQGKDPGSYNTIRGNYVLHWIRREHGDALAKALAALEAFAKAEVRNIPVGRLKWVDRPAERERVPASHFLLPKERKFPYRNKDGSINCRLLRAAISRAAQHGYKDVEERARRLYKRHCQNGR